jgi:6-phosphogluconolactonase (cycloisomerase 2 family)
MIGRICVLAATVASVLAAAAAAASGASAAPRAVTPAVYTQTNLPSGNAVIWFTRSRSGALTQVRAYPTGGLGAPNSHSHFPITDSSRSLVINPQRTLLFVVNHGSGSITSFRIRANGGLQRANVAPSGGTGPASLAIRADGLLYVVNEAPPARIRGFHVTAGGLMVPISGATRTLAYPNSSPGQVGFDRSGRFLVVTDRFGGTSEADQDYFEIFRLSRAGLPTALPPVRSVPPEPYAFAFTSRNEMIVADAANNAPGASFTSSYLFGGGGGLTPVKAEPTGQSAGCWIAITKDERFAFVTSGFSTTVLSYSLSRGGGFKNISPAGATPLSGIGGDVALTSGSEFLYALNIDPKLVNMDLSARSDIDAYRVGRNGSLTRIGTFAMGQLPFTSSGLAAL